MDSDILESILYSVKKLLGIEKDYTAFDEDIIIHINTAFFNLYQLGVGDEKKAFTIKDGTTTWNEFIKDGMNFEAIKTYIYLKVKLLFDPPVSSFVSEAYKRSIDELEWRMYVEADPYPMESLTEEC